MNKRLLLPLGLTGALLTALLFPMPGLWLARHQTAFLFVAAMFLINGYQTNLQAFPCSRRFLGAFILTALMAFVAGWLGHLVTSLVHFDATIALGLVIMSAMPPTLSSVVVITKESGGDTLWSLLMTIGLSLLGIVTIPLMLTALLARTSVALPVWPLFADLSLSVLVPFALGVLLQRLIRKEPTPLVNLLPTLLIIILSYMSFSAGREKIITNSALTLISIIVAALAIHLTLFVTALGLAKLCRYSLAERKAIAFISSQKTLPIAIGVLASLGVTGGAAAVPCVIFHFVQLLCDSVIAFRWRTHASVARTRIETSANVASPSFTKTPRFPSR
ncbi:MAG TPA: bile acid:sodium symporter [Armatimonadota bacterium]